MQSNIGIIISREFSERVAKKSFIITTLLMPVLMLLLMAAPALIAEFTTPSNRVIAVSDNSGLIYPRLASDGALPDYITLTETTLPADSLAIAANTGFDGVLIVGKDIVDNPSDVKLYLRDAGSIELETAFTSVIKQTVEAERLKHYNIENLNEILAEISADVHLQTIRVDETGESESTSSALSFIIGIVMTFILYMFLLMYGQMVMTSIIEEKNNRVLELVVSSVKPLQLMLGKIIGVGLVAVVQVTIWGVLICLMSAFLLPALMPEALSQEVALAGAGALNSATATFDPELIQIVSLLGSVGYIAKLFGMMTLFLIGGFLFFASIFAAIGSAVDNIQDASQLQSFAIIPIIVALMFSLSVGNDPNSTAALWMSMIPFTSPMVMLARIPFDIASWQIWLSLVILYLSFVAMAWIAAKIYRVGIFMYGKKPTIKDLIRWARYK
ncbi:MAG: ABC transporter permease [Muribaculaceae bacterium]|nr:ABC transporter permease [Muribaculaceae bacterium]